MLTRSSLRLHAASGIGGSFSGTGRFTRQRKGWMVAVLACAVATGCLFAQETNRAREKAKQDHRSLQAGRQTFESTCVSCHGLDGRGGERGPDIATRAEVVRLSDVQISKILRTGIPQSGMPGFAALGSAKLLAILSHLRFLQGKSDPPRLPGNAATGKELFAGKAGCSQCHMVQGQGGFIGPDLTNYGAGHAASGIRDAIVSSDKRSGSNKMLAKVTTRDGQTVSGMVRNEDNFSLQLQSLDGALHLLRKSDVAEFAYDSKPLMPADYATQLSREELNHLVAYLLRVAYAGQEKKAATSKARKTIPNED